MQETGAKNLDAWIDSLRPYEGPLRAVEPITDIDFNVVSALITEMARDGGPIRSDSAAEFARRAGVSTDELVNVVSGILFFC